jgi:hypothetical protein
LYAIWLGRSVAAGGHTAARPEATMFVSVIHRIHDPKGFKAAEAKAMAAGLPATIALPIHAATGDHRLGICIWEGESVAAVREVVEGVVGPFSDNEYSQMEVDGLTPQLAK